MKKFETEIRLSREMGLLDATMIGVGAMIGAGIFVLVGIAAGVAGPALILAFVLNGLVALLTAMSYAELGSCFHDAGGGYLWVKEGLPKWNGFLSGWMSWFAHAVACSLYALGFGAYFEHVFREIGLTVPHWGFLSPQKFLAASVALAFAYVNYRGASETGKIGNLVTIAKIVILVIFIGFGLELMFRTPNWPSHFEPFMANGWSGVFKAMGLTFIAFQGFEVIAQSSEEIENPRKNIPRAVFLSLAIVVPIYLLVAVSALGSVNPEASTPWDYLARHKELALVEVSRHFFIGGGIMILVGGLISTMSALNATIYSSSRVAFAMGRDRNFPAFFSRVNTKNFTPHWAIAVSLIIIVFMSVSLPIEDVASAADIMFLLLFLQVNIAMIRLRKSRPDLDRGFMSPLYPWLSIIGIVMLLFLALYMFHYSIAAWAVTGVWILAGLSLYNGYSSHREVLHLHKVRSLKRIEKQEYSILTCISSPRTASSLTHIAFALSKKHRSEIVFLNIVEVREGQQLIAGIDEARADRPLLLDAERRAMDAGVPARAIVRVSHRLSRGIVDTAREENCNFIVMGRQQKPDFFERVFSSFIDTVFYEVPSEIAILHGVLYHENIKRIVVPFGANIHTRLAMEFASALADYFKADLTIAVVFDPTVTKAERETVMDQLQEEVRRNAPTASVDILKEESVLEGILKRSSEADLLVMGGKTGDFIELLFAESLTRQITEQARCPVLWLREYEEKVSFWSSLFKREATGGKRHG
jgi:amino acid transporter/nucleotide-binding universal stress UspA family protein